MPLGEIEGFEEAIEILSEPNEGNIFVDCSSATNSLRRLTVMASADEKTYNSLVARHAVLQAKKKRSRIEVEELEEIEANLGDSTDLKSYQNRLAQLQKAEADVKAGKGISLDDLASSLRRRGIQE